MDVLDCVALHAVWFCMFPVSGIQFINIRYLSACDDDRRHFWLLCSHLRPVLRGSSSPYRAVMYALPWLVIEPPLLVYK